MTGVARNAALKTQHRNMIHKKNHLQNVHYQIKAWKNTQAAGYQNPTIPIWWLSFMPENHTEVLIFHIYTFLDEAFWYLIS